MALISLTCDSSGVSSLIRLLHIRQRFKLDPENDKSGIRRLSATEASESCDPRALGSVVRFQGSLQDLFSTLRQLIQPVGRWPWEESRPLKSLDSGRFISWRRETDGKWEVGARPQKEAVPTLCTCTAFACKGRPWLLFS